MLKHLLFIVLFVFSCNLVHAQVAVDTIDNKYLEDQIFLSLNYNVLLHVPEESESSLFSGGFSLGIIKDIPINKRRNVALGIGLGYGFKSYKNNIEIFEDVPGGGVTNDNLKNTVTVNSVEIPFEFRWRTSTPTKYNFWRIYPGFQVAYAFYTKAKVSYKGDEITFYNIDAFNNLQYGATLSAGYGNWNINFYYGLNKVFNEENVAGEQVKLQDFTIGLKFYIL